MPTPFAFTRRSISLLALLAMAATLIVALPGTRAEAAARPGPYLDQRLNGNPACTVTQFPGTASVIERQQAQEFVPSRGDLSVVDLCMNNGTAQPIQFTVTLYQLDDFGALIRPSLATTQVVAAPGTRWSTARFSGVVAMAAGSPYVIEVGPIGISGILEWRLTCPRNVLTGQCDVAVEDRYPDGSARSTGGPQADFGFRTHTPYISDLTAEVVDHVGHVCPGVTSDVAVEITNAAPAGTDGASFTRDFHVRPYLSPVLPGANGAVPAGAVALSDKVLVQAVAPEASRVETLTTTVPSSLPWEGPSYLLVDVDSEDKVHESPTPTAPVEDNNNIAVATTVVTTCGDPSVTTTLGLPEGGVYPGLTGVNFNWLLREHPGALTRAFTNPAATPLDSNPLDSNPLDSNPLDSNPLDSNPLDSNPLDSNPLDSNPLDSNPLDSNPLDSNPLDSNPLDSNALQRAPLDSNPLDSNPLDSNNFLASAPRAVVDSISLSQVDTRIEGGWAAALAGTSLANMPLQSVTLGDLFALPSSQAVRLVDAEVPVAGSSPTYYTHVTRVERPGDRSMQLRDVTLRGTPLQSLSLAAIAAGNTPLANIDLPSGSWCDIAAAQGFPCSSSGVDEATDSLVTLELLGVNLARVDFGDLALSGVQFSDSAPIAGVYLPSQAVRDGDWQFKLQLTDLATVVVSDLSDATLVDCDAYAQSGPGGAYPPSTPCAAADLGTVGIRGAFRNGSTVADLLAAVPASTLDEVSFGQMVLGTIGDPMHFPWDQLDLDALAALQPDGASFTATATVTGTGSFINPTVTFTAPAGFAPVVATAAADGLSVASVTTTTGADGSITVDVATTGFVARGASAAVSLGFSTPLGLGARDVGQAAQGPTVAPGGNAPAIGTWLADAATGTVTVVERLEPNDDHASSIWFEDSGSTGCAGAGAADCKRGGPILIGPNGLYASHISTSGDIDLFSVAVPAVTNAGVTIRLNPPAGTDLDLRVWAPGVSPLSPNPLDSNPLDSNPLDSNAGPRAISDVVAGANQIVPYIPSETLSDAPLDSNPLDSNPLDSNGFTTSTNRGSNDETVRLIVRPGDSGFYTIEVYGYNGAVDTAPYTLSVSVTSPPQISGLDVCQERVFGHEATGVSTLPLASTANPATETLILVNNDRFERTFGAARTAEMMAGLEAFAAGTRRWDSTTGTWVAGGDTGVRGLVIPVEADPAVAQAYADWDATNGPCDPSRANATAMAIREVVMSYRAELPGIRNVLLVGSDELLPMLRIADATTLSNEQDFAGSAAAATAVGAAAGNALTWSLAAGTYLTDDHYGASVAKEFLDHHVFIPDTAVGRLVDNPETVVAALRQFTQAQGELSPQIAAASGYDFLSDGATLMADELDAATGLTTARTINDGWSRQDLVAQVPTAADSFFFPNGHADYHRFLPADLNAAHREDAEGLFQVGKGYDDLATLGARAIVGSMGCHFGLNIADTLGAQPVEDWADAVAKRQGILVAATGFQYGDTEAVAVGEVLMSLWAGQLDDTVSVAESLAMAKALYMAEAGEYGVYDAKGMSEIVLYGIPNYRVAGVSTTTSNLAATATATASTPTHGNATVSLMNASLGNQAAGTCTSGGNCLVPNQTSTGTFYTVEGPNGARPVAINGLPVVPQMVLDVPPGDPVHGALITSMSSITQDVVGFDPVFSHMITDGTQAGIGSQAFDVIFPTLPARVTSISSPQGSLQKLVLFPSMVTIEENATVDNGQVKARLRLDTDFDVALYRSTSDDILEPRITEVKVTAVGGGVQFDVVTVDEDGLHRNDAVPGGVQRVLALYRGSDGIWRSADLTEVGGHWSLLAPLPVASADVELIVQSVDLNGNIGYFHNKGQPVPLQDAALPFDITGQAGRGGWFLGPVTVDLRGPVAETYTYTVNHGVEREVEGHTFTIADDGRSVLDIWSSEGREAHDVVIAIDAGLPTATIHSPVATQPGDTTYRAGDVLRVSYDCSDAVSGVHRCQGSVPNGTNLVLTQGTHTVTVVAEDVAGNSVMVQRTFHVAPAPLVFEGFFSPIKRTDDGTGTNWTADDIRVQNAGSTLPFKWRIYQGGSPLINDPSHVTSKVWQRVSCTNPNSKIGGPIAPTSSSDTAWWDKGDAYHFNADIPESFGGNCYRFTLTLRDGQVRSTVVHIKKK